MKSHLKVLKREHDGHKSELSNGLPASCAGKSSEECLIFIKQPARIHPLDHFVEMKWMEGLVWLGLGPSFSNVTDGENSSRSTKEEPDIRAEYSSSERPDCKEPWKAFHHPSSYR